MNAVPDSLMQTILEVCSPRRVVLFGSHVRGEAELDSDLDLLVVLNDGVPSEVLSWRHRNEARRRYTGSVDIVPCRQGVLRERACAAGSFADTILREGVVVYERH
jgi:predicted nucleotidyltransferase